MFELLNNYSTVDLVGAGLAASFISRDALLFFIKCSAGFLGLLDDRVVTERCF